MNIDILQLLQTFCAAFVKLSTARLAIGRNPKKRSFSVHDSQYTAERTEVDRNERHWELTDAYGTISNCLNFRNYFS